MRKRIKSLEDPNEMANPISTAVLMLCLSASVVSCARYDPLRSFIGSYRRYTETKGNVQKDRYTSPQGNFSCKVPALLKPGAVVKDSFSKKEGTGMVVFADDFGLQLMVQWYEIPTNANAVSDSALLEQIAVSIKEMDKKSLRKVTFGKESLGAVDQPTLFYLATAEMADVKVYIPRSQRDTVTKESMIPHIFRGHSFFRRGGWIYVLTSQEDSLLRHENKTPDQREKDLRSKLEKYLTDFEFK